MEILNKAQVDELFKREAVLIGTKDVVLVSRVMALFGEGAVKHARRRIDREYWNSYGTGDCSLDYLTHRGFQEAASFYNVQMLREEAES